MLIGIDASRAVRARRTGTETYSLRLIQALARQATGHTLRLYTDGPTTIPGISTSQTADDREMEGRMPSAPTSPTFSAQMPHAAQAASERMKTFVVTASAVRRTLERLKSLLPRGRFSGQMPHAAPAASERMKTFVVTASAVRRTLERLPVLTARPGKSPLRRGLFSGQMPHAADGRTGADENPYVPGTLEDAWHVGGRFSGQLLVPSGAPQPMKTQDRSAVGGRRSATTDEVVIEVQAMPFPRLWTHVRLSAEMVIRPPDVLFVPAHVLPLIHPRRSVVTVHDLGYLHYAEAHRGLDRLYLDWSTRWNAHQATAVLADSQATRSDLMRAYGVDGNKIHVVYLGRDESLAPVQDRNALAAVRTRYGLAERYLLYVGTLQPRKNLSRVIEAFARVAGAEAFQDVQLVLAGKPGWLYDTLVAQVERLGLQERVRFPGYIPDDDLPALLSAALAFVFPSLYEGFGIPVLEAGACGVPVLTSNTSSLPEVAGDAALLVDPHDVDAIADAMYRLVTDEALRAELTRRGMENVKRFSWEKCARETLEVLVEAGSGKREAGSWKLGAGSWKLEAGSGKLEAGSGKLEAGSGKLEAGSGKLETERADTSEPASSVQSPVHSLQSPAPSFQSPAPSFQSPASSVQSPAPSPQSPASSFQSPAPSPQSPASSFQYPACRILGVRVDALTYADLLDAIGRFIAEGTPHQICTLNPEFVMEAQSNRAFREVLERADLCLADGVGLLWAARRQGARLPERVTGSDGLPLIAERAATAGWRLYLLGAAPGVAERTAQILQARYPGLQVVGTYAGSPDDAEAPEIIGRIRTARPDILFVAYGAPRQDLWIARHREALGVPVMMAVGGAFDHIAGVQRRAPRWLQRFGLEWLFRLITQPWRWRRQLALPRFVWAVLWQKKRVRTDGE